MDQHGPESSILTPNDQAECIFIVIPSIVAQHAEEASFLVGQRTAAVSAPHYSLKDLARLDLRLLAHLDGLHIAGEEGEKASNLLASEKEDGSTFVAAWLAFAADKIKPIDTLFVPSGNIPNFVEEVNAALGWFPFEKVREIVSSSLSASAPPVRAIGLIGSALYGQDPGSALADAFESPEVTLRSSAARAAGFLRRRDLLWRLYDALEDQDEVCRYRAAWALSLNGDPRPLTDALLRMKLREPVRREALDLILRNEDPTNVRVFVEKLSGKGDLMRDRIMAAAAAGDPASVPWLFEQMLVPELARIAGESFSTITGLNISLEDLDVLAPAGFQAGPVDDPEDEKVEMDPDENLPWPDVDAVMGWWRVHEPKLTPGSRYLLGKPITTEWLRQVLRIGRQRHRASAAVEIAKRMPGDRIFDVNSPGFTQQELLGTS